jgi:hypothetical protein
MIGIYLALFFGGAFFVNAMPHFVSAVQGRKFPTPFAKPSWPRRFLHARELSLG